MAKPIRPICHYFVDEAGDPAVFGRRGKVLVGTPGTSLAFMIGVCELPDPAGARAVLDKLRSDLLTDPYLRGIPSMQPAAGKTARFFHAKDDCPEVRREVFRVLPALGPKMMIAIRRKSHLLDLARAGARLTDTTIYHDTISRASKNLLHHADEVRVVVANRGNSTRNAPLLKCLQDSRDKFNRRWDTDHKQPIRITIGSPSDHAGLQVADYLLWAVQRLYSAGEDRFFNAVSETFSLVHDIDDTRSKNYGVFYTARNPLRLDTVLPLATG
jgi:hypothetical protein